MVNTWDFPYGVQMAYIWAPPYGMYICVPYDCQQIVSVWCLYSILCVPYAHNMILCVYHIGIHMVYICATHMECTDEYHMEDQYGVHVTSIWDHVCTI